MSSSQRLNDEFRSDLLWWQAFLAPFNHRPMRRVVGSTHSKISDASGGIGCGAFWPPYWCQFKWTDSVVHSASDIRDESITLMELLLLSLHVQYGANGGRTPRLWSIVTSKERWR